MLRGIGGVMLGLMVGCSTGTAARSGAGAGGNGTSKAVPFNSTGAPPSDPSRANHYSWDGSWTPSAGEFPLAGLLDTDPTQSGLPPGRWGWDGACSCAGNTGTAIYDNEFVAKGLDFEQLVDDAARHFGWRLVDTDGGTSELDHRGDAFDGSRGVDLLDLDRLASTGPGTNTPGINLGEGPDMLRYRFGQSVDMRTGSTERGALFDNDLVILGSEQTLGQNEYEINGTTIHTGPGSDLVFVRNFGPGAIDLGNGDAGRTDMLDPADGDDLAILSGNMRDFRVYGGHGDDVFVWYVDEVRDDRFLGPSFYGGGAWGNATWNDDGTDRLVLAVDPATTVVTQRSDHDAHAGSLLAFVYSDYAPSIDTPTADDPFARYYGLVATGPHDEHTITLSYRSSDGLVFTQDFYLTSVERLQLGVSAAAQVYLVDQTTGRLTIETDGVPFTRIPARVDFNDLFDSFGR